VHKVIDLFCMIEWPGFLDFLVRFYKSTSFQTRKLKKNLEQHKCGYSEIVTPPKVVDANLNTINSKEIHEIDCRGAAVRLKGYM